MATDLLSTICREIDERLNELRPLLAERERLLVATDALVEESPKPASKSPARAAAKPERAARGAAREAILGALEHGSHTVGELVVVTAMSTTNVNGNLRRLRAEGVVVKAEREGKAAWALRDAAA